MANEKNVEPIELPDASQGKANIIRRQAADKTDKTVKSEQSAMNSDNPVQQQVTQNTDLDTAQLASEEEAAIMGVSKELPPTISTPLDNPVVDRSYTAPAVSGVTAAPIEEPTIQKQVIDVNQNINNSTPSELRDDQKKDWEKTKEYATGQLGEKEAGSAPGNPAVTTMSNKERKENLDHTVETAIFYYAQAKLFLASIFTFSENKMLKMEAKGEIKIDWAILEDKSTNEVLTLREFIRDANEQIIEACKTSDEFKEKLRPLLKAELERRGWILSPEQNIFALVGADLLVMGRNLFTINQNMNIIIKKAAAEFADAKEGGFISSRKLYNDNLNASRYYHQEPAPQPNSTQTGVSGQTNPGNQEKPTTTAVVEKAKSEVNSTKAVEPDFEDPTAK